MEKVNISQKLALFKELWSPRIVGELNGQYVKLAKVKGEFVWHKHDREDELFLVIKVTLVIQFRDKEIKLNEGEFLIVPQKTEHKTIAEEETHILLFEPQTTLTAGSQTTANNDVSL